MAEGRSSMSNNQNLVRVETNLATSVSADGDLREE